MKRKQGKAEKSSGTVAVDSGRQLSAVHTCLCRCVLSHTRVRRPVLLQQGAVGDTQRSWTRSFTSLKEKHKFIWSVSLIEVRRTGPTRGLGSGMPSQATQGRGEGNPRKLYLKATETSRAESRPRYKAGIATVRDTRCDVLRRPCYSVCKLSEDRLFSIRSSVLTKRHPILTAQPVPLRSSAAQEGSQHPGHILPVTSTGRQDKLQTQYSLSEEGKGYRPRRGPMARTGLPVCSTNPLQAFFISPSL